MKYLLAIYLLFTVSHNVAADTAIKLFHADHFQQILAQYSKQAFVLVLWSLDCPPCYKELALLGRERKQHSYNLVLISTDGAESIDEVAAVLKNNGLQGADNWLFSELGSAPLRYQIDPLWYGELPRSYLYTSDHQRTAISGVLTSTQLSSYK
ncbi:MAG: redoxin domain-containing protein [Gammaproteobacteria bacterium]|nr:redoxin domain-containing protein [Gammaproteobacteria bacterium]